MRSPALRHELDLVSREKFNHGLLVLVVFALAVLPIFDLIIG